MTLLKNSRINQRSIASLSRTLSHDREALMQLLLSLCKKNTLHRIARCPTYPVRTITVDLKERLQLFHDSVSCDRYEISNILAFLFESAAERKCRKLSGQYFTPRYVAKKAISFLELKHGETIMDPGCGTGIFPLGILRNLANSATVDCGSLTYLGVESDPILALSTAISLDWVNAPMNWRVLYANFLYVDRHDIKKVFGHDLSVDAIIANPPYVRHHLLGRRKGITNKLSMRWGNKSLSLRSGLHSLFLAHSAELLERGRMIFIVPMEMIASKYGSALLEPLQRTFTVKDSVVYYDHKNSAWKTENLHQFNLEKHSEVRQAWTLAYFQYIPNCAGQRLSPRTPKAEGKAAALRLKDIAALHRGISTGANEFFVLTDAKVNAMGLSDTDYVRMVIPTRIRKDELPTIFTIKDWSRLKENGKPCWLLCLPYKNPDELPCSIREYIRKGERDGIHLIPTCKHRKPWYHIKVDQHHISDLVFTYMSRGYPKFIYNEARAYNLTNLLGIYLSASIRTSEPKMTNLVQQLNIELKKWIDQEAVGRKYFGGLVKFEPGDLKNMPIYEQGLVKSLGIVSLASSF